MNVTMSLAAALSARSPSGLDAPAGPRVPSLPPPVEGVDKIQDALAMVCASLAAIESAQTATAKGSVATAKGRREAAEHQRQEALERARKEAEKGGLFHTIASDLGVVGVVGLATFSYTAVAADWAIHKSGLVRDMKIDAVDAAIALAGSPQVIVADLLLRKSELSPDAVKEALGRSFPGITDKQAKPLVEKAMMVNLLVLGAATSIATAGSSTALVLAIIGVALSGSGALVQELDGPKALALGLQIGGAAFSIGSACTSLASSAAVNAGARALQSGTMAARGADIVVGTVHQKAAEDAQLDAQEMRHELQKLARLIDTVIDGLKETHESKKQALETVNQAIDTHNQTLTMASAMRG